MGTRVCASLTIESIKDKFVGHGETEKVINLGMGINPLPEGRFGGPRWKAHEMQQHAHDAAWGMLSVQGNLQDHDLLEEFQSWWFSIVRFFDGSRDVGAPIGAIAVQHIARDRHVEKYPCNSVGSGRHDGSSGCFEIQSVLECVAGVRKVAAWTLRT